MPDVIIDSFEVVKGESPGLLNQVYGYAGTGITQATVSAINLYVYRKPDYSTDLASGASITISSAVSDTFVTNNSRWTKDSIGYNFSYTLPATYTDTVGVLLVRIKLTMSDATVIWLLWNGQVVSEK